MSCFYPQSIPNPNFGKGHIGYNFLKDCESRYLSIPCGYCPYCVSVKQMYMVQRIQMEAEYNNLFFGTLTYNNECLPVIEVNDIPIRYADRSHLVLTIKRLRNDCAFGRNDWRYFFVSELGSLRGRPHFHILFLFPKLPGETYLDMLNLEKLVYSKLMEYWSFNVGTNRKPVYVPRFTFTQRFIHGKLKSNYDLHYANPALTVNGICDVAFYIIKYMLKYSDRTLNLQRALRLNLDEDDYKFFWNLVRPTWQSSLGFGLNTYHGRKDERIVKYLHECVQRTPNGVPYPCFYNPLNGMQFPLAPYYKKIGSIFSMEDALRLYYNSSAEYVDDSAFHFDKFTKSFNDYVKKVVSVETHGDDVYFDELCD